MVVLVIVAAIINVVWWLSGVGYNWPAWPMLGFAIAIFFTALSTYGPASKPISEEEIDREMRKYQSE